MKTLISILLLYLGWACALEISARYEFQDDNYGYSHQRLELDGNYNLNEANLLGATLQYHDFRLTEKLNGLEPSQRTNTGGSIYYQKQFDNLKGKLLLGKESALANSWRTAGELAWSPLVHWTLLLDGNSAPLQSSVFSNGVRSTLGHAAIQFAHNEKTLWGEAGSSADWRSYPYNLLRNDYVWIAKGISSWFTLGLSASRQTAQTDMSTITAVENDTALYVQYPYSAPLELYATNAILQFKHTFAMRSRHFVTLLFKPEIPLWSNQKLRWEDPYGYATTETYYYYADNQAALNMRSAIEYAHMSGWKVACAHRYTSAPVTSRGYGQASAWNSSTIQTTLSKKW